MTDRRPVVVVGAGLAGLTCAYRLTQSGVPVSVYEARDRIGGRCWSARELVDGKVGEHGGEFISPWQTSILRLVDELGLDLEPSAANPRGEHFIDGEPVDREGVERDAPAFAEAITRLADEVGDFRFDRANARARSADERSIAEWLDAEVGREAALHRVMHTLVSGLLGAEPAQVSSLMLVELFASAVADSEPPFSLFAFMRGTIENERHVVGGNDRIAQGLADRLPAGTITFETPLEAIGWDGDHIRLRFGGEAGNVVAERVVLTLPFTALREVDLAESGFGPERITCIEELQMGQNTKLLLALDRQAATIPGWPGFVGTDEDHLFVWDSTRSQPGETGIVTAYTGYALFESAPGTPHGPAPGATVDDAVRRIDRLAPGVASATTGTGWLDSWIDDPWVRGSYVAFAPGQITRWWGFTGLPEGPIHFAGEHTSTESQGYMDGAIESGDRAAREVLAAARG